MPYLLKFTITKSNNSYSNLHRSKVSIAFTTKFSPFLDSLNSRRCLKIQVERKRAGLLTIFLAVKQKSVWPERGSWSVCFRGTGPSRNSERDEMSLDDVNSARRATRSRFRRKCVTDREAYSVNVERFLQYRLEPIIKIFDDWPRDWL